MNKQTYYTILYSKLRLTKTQANLNGRFRKMQVKIRKKHPNQYPKCILNKMKHVPCGTSLNSTKLDKHFDTSYRFLGQAVAKWRILKVLNDTL